MTAMAKQTTVRLPDELADEVDAVARAKGTSVNQLIIDAFKSMQDHAQRNMTMFSEAMKVFNPFAAALGGSIPGAPAPGRSQPQGGSGSSKDDLQALKDQLAAMQQKLDTLTNK